MAGASKPVDVSTKQQRIAQLARQSPEMGFTSLAYIIDLDWLREAFDRTRKDGAVGVDGQDGEDYAANLEANKKRAIAITSQEVYDRYIKYLTGCADFFHRGISNVGQFTLVKA